MSDEAVTTPQPQFNTLSIVALVLGGLGLLLALLVPPLGLLLAIGGVITGHIALGQTRQRGERGRELGITALVLGYLVLAVGVLLILFGIGFADSVDHGQRGACSWPTPPTKAQEQRCFNSYGN